MPIRNQSLWHACRPVCAIGLIVTLAGCSRTLAGKESPSARAIPPDSETGTAGIAYFPPPDAQGGWRVPRDAAEALRVAGVDVRKLDQAFAQVDGQNKNGGLLVVRDGWLVYERYFGRGHREATPNLASCGKSFTSIAVGILLDERPDLFPRGLDQEIMRPEYLPEDAFPLTDPAKAEIKLGHLLAMSSGLRGMSPGHVNGEPRKISPEGPNGAAAMVDAIAFGHEDDLGARRGPASAKTLWCKPGGGYSYATAGVHLASAMLRHITGMELEQFISQRLAQPMGWSRWGYAYRNTPGRVHTPGGGGIALRGTDMLRFGHLLLNGGRWNGKQLVPAAYVRDATNQSPYNPHFPYSLQFNVNTHGEQKTLPRDAFWKRGSGGHALYVVPSARVVAFKLGGRDDQYDQKNTGLPRPSGTEAAERERVAWTQTAAGDDDAARVMTLELILGAIVRP